jgi:hypothetical protein
VGKRALNARRMLVGWDSRVSQLFFAILSIGCPGLWAAAMSNATAHPIMAITENKKRFQAFRSLLSPTT